MVSGEGFKNWSQGVFYIIIIAVIALGAIWVVISIGADFMEDNNSDLPRMPGKSKADTQLIMKSTGDVILVKNYEVSWSPHDPTKQLYTVQPDYYVISDGKWRKKSVTLPLDEFYWGDIIVVKR